MLIFRFRRKELFIARNGLIKSLESFFLNSKKLGLLDDAKVEKERMA